MNFESCQELVSLQTANLQLDIFRDNGQVLIQIYKYSDVKKWNNGIDFGEEEGFILEVNFHQSKTNNDANFDNFKSISCKLVTKGLII